MSDAAKSGGAAHKPTTKTKTKKQVLDMKFMIPTLQNILKWTWKKETFIRAPVQDVLDIIEKRIEGKPLKMQDCFQAMILGCQYKKDKVQLACLQCMLEMVSRSFLKYCKKCVGSVIAAVSGCKQTNNEDIQFAVLKVVRDIAIGAGFVVHGADLLELFGVCGHLAIASKHSDLRKIAHDFMLKIHAHTYELVQAADEAHAAPTSAALYPEVFQALKFAVKLPFGSNHRDALALFARLATMAKQKDTAIIALTLLKDALVNWGSVMKHHTEFTDCIRVQLCTTLLQNCVSELRSVVELSLEVFVSLITGFREFLRGEIEIFITDIFLRVLESSSSTFERKALVLKVFSRISKDRTTILEIFLNYDAKADVMSSAGGLLERIVDAMVRVTQGKGQDLKLKHSALESLQAVLACIYKFVADYRRVEEKKQEAEEAARAAEAAAAEAAVDEVEAAASGGGAATSPSSRRQSALGTEAETAAQLEAADAELDAVALAASTSSTPGVGGKSRASINEAFQSRKLMAREVHAAVEMFNKKPKRGIAHLVDKGLVKRTPDAVAAFLWAHNENLSKTQIGEYIGGEDEWALGVMHAFIDQMNFAAMDLDMSLRAFLSGFRLPGEAQKIDRILEKFASKYCEQNPSTFESADTAFILSFAIIMLNTDLHNPGIKPERKMSLESFLKTCKRATTELSDETLTNIFHRIKEDEITLKEDDALRSTQASTTTNVFNRKKQQSEQFAREREHMLREAEIKRRQAAGGHGAAATAKFVRLDDLAKEGQGMEQVDESVQEIFLTLWEPLHRVFSDMLRGFDQQSIVQLCINGIRMAVGVACHYAMHAATRAYMATLARGTELTDPFRQKSPRARQCIKLLMDIAHTEGDRLGEAWEPLMQAISQLSRLEALALGGGEHMFNTSDPRAGQLQSIFSSRERDEAQMRAVSEEVMNELEPDTIDRVFVKSPALAADSVYALVQAMANVGLVELDGANVMTSGKAGGAGGSSGGGAGGGDGGDGASGAPRVFCLQKLVEVADYNIKYRSRIQWSNIWRIMSQQFAVAGTHSDPFVAQYAIDSLKQLSFKFMDKKENRGFHFQEAFMQPFERIMLKSRNNSNRELILYVMGNIVDAKHKMLASGWKRVISVLAIAADSGNDELVNLAFSIAQKICLHHFQGVADNNNFIALVHCLHTFSRSGIRDVCREALPLVRLAADQLSRGRIPLRDIKLQVSGNSGADTPALALQPSPGSSSGGDQEDSVNADGFMEFTDSENHIGAWFPLLTGLLRSIQHPLEEQRQRAVQVLFDILVCNAPRFSEGFWTLVFKGVLFPIFADVTHLQAADVSTHTLEGKWLRTTCTQALSCLVGLFDVAFPQVQFMVFELFELMYKFVAQDVQELASIGIDGLRQLLVRREAEEDDAEFLDAQDQEQPGLPKAQGSGGGSGGGGDDHDSEGGSGSGSDSGTDDAEDDEDEEVQADGDDESDEVDVGGVAEDSDESGEEGEEGDAAAEAGVGEGATSSSSSSSSSRPGPKPVEGDPYGLHRGPSLTRELGGPKKRQTVLVFHPDRVEKLLDCQPAAHLSEAQWTHLCGRLQALMVACMPTADARAGAPAAAGAGAAGRKAKPQRTLSVEQREQLLSIQSRIQLDLIGAVGAIYNRSLRFFTPAQHEVMLAAFFHADILSPLQQHGADEPYVLDSKMTVAIKALATVMPALFRLHSIGEEKHAILDIAMKFIKQPCEMLITEYNKLQFRLGKFLRKRRRLQKAKKEAELVEMKKQEPKMRQVEKVVFAITPVLLKLLVGFQEMHVDEFHAHLPWLYPLVAELVRSENFDLRCTIQKILLRVFPLVTTALVEDTESLL